MKKLICILVFFAILVSFVACKTPDNNENQNTDNSVGDENNENTEPHTHVFTDGKCECGEIDPGYVPNPDLPTSTTVYLINRAKWDEVAFYCWNWSDPHNPEKEWPGEKLSVGDDGLYKVTVSSEYSSLVFNNNNNGSQTVDLEVPTGDRVVYDNLYNFWISYTEAMNIIESEKDDNPDPDPHTHVFVDGKCECGETDPNYNPGEPHDHEYINGKCECGAINPYYNPIPDIDPDPNVITVFLLNRENWNNVSFYYWNNQGEGKRWPGIELSLGNDGLYRATLDKSYPNLIFNNNNQGAQTSDLKTPTDDKIVYDNRDKVWITYNEAIEILYPNLTPHIHVFVEGKCECGEIDPNYVPEPHIHVFVEGKCECGEVDPNYIPPHVHEFIQGKCLCGEVDPDYVLEPGVDEELALFYDLFDYNNHISIKLNISNSELKKIQKDYEKYSGMGSKSPIYRMADLVVTITKPNGTSTEYVVEQVGVRMKGNTSRTSFYSDNDGMYNLIHFKVSFQETFDDAGYYGKDALVWADADARKARKNRTFATLEKIDMRWNRNDDTTYIRENYAYDLYREFGVLAPHTNLASVDIGKDHAGVWVIYEPVDKIFLEKNLPAEALGGDLYKLGWTNEGATFTSFSNYGIEDEDAGKFYVYDLKTNKKTSTHSSLKNLINTLKMSSLTKDSFAEVVDIENFMYYCAVSYIVGNPDDLRYNYNNSYIYFRPDTGKMMVIPYDMDRGLGVNTWNPSGNGMTKVDPFNKWTSAGDQRSPLFLKSICTGGFFVEEYKEALKTVDASDLLTNEKFEEIFNIASNLYSSEAKPSKNYNNAGGYKFRFDINRTCSPNESKNMSFADYMYAKRTTLYKYIGDQGNNESGSSSGSTPTVNNRPYVMGDMTGWQMNEQYAMKSNGDGTYTITLTTSDVSQSYNRIKFKIYDDYNGAWYGYEIVDPNCTVNYNDITGNSNGNKNYYLAPGTYVLTFDSRTVTLYIEKK